MAPHVERALGLGVDVLEVARMKRFIQRHQSRLARIFSKKERMWAQSAAKPAVRFACLFAAKEAVFKSLGLSPVSFFRWNEIEIFPQKTPYRVKLTKTMKKRICPKLETVRAVWQIKDRYAVAFALKGKVCAGF